ncbi:AAA family ATPase, partial [Roseobacter sp. HKCCA0434]|uniref:AAA family ATPase n=1 Tax=Roseobacter sp. HKCCA0434 TaxID=3079297 RepID=UPI002905D524
MRILSITLDNVRRFTDPVRIGPIGDGVTLLSEPNEAGKSTLFDALHALFFQPHRSAKAEIKALQPHSGGKVAVECELHHEGADWRVRKEWLRGATARVWREGTLVHQDDAAEDWIAALVSGDAGGPGGLLWVRQGRVSLQAPAKKSEEQEKAERRDLLTAISGAMDDVTGGERMDRARDRVEADLARYQTATGRVSGVWKEAETQVQDLTAREAELAALVESLRDDLDTRDRNRQRLAELRDPDLAQKRRIELEAAEAALREAEGRARDLKGVEATAKLAVQNARVAREEAERRVALRMELAEARKALAAAETADEEARAKADAARRTLAEAKASRASRRVEQQAAEETMGRVERAERAAAAAGERARLAASLEQAEAADKERIAHRAAAKEGPDTATVEAIEALVHECEARRRAREAASPRVSVRYEAGAAQVVVGGAPLAEGETRALPPG